MISLFMAPCCCSAAVEAHRRVSCVCLNAKPAIRGAVLSAFSSRARPTSGAFIGARLLAVAVLLLWPWSKWLRIGGAWRGVGVCVWGGLPRWSCSAWRGSLRTSLVPSGPSPPRHPRPVGTSLARPAPSTCRTCPTNQSYVSSRSASRASRCDIMMQSYGFLCCATVLVGRASTLTVACNPLPEGDGWRHYSNYSQGEPHPLLNGVAFDHPL